MHARVDGPADAPAQTSHWPDNYGPASAWWTVFILMIFQIVSMIDRQVISVLIPEMRADLGLNDFQISWCKACPSPSSTG